MGDLLRGLETLIDVQIVCTHPSKYLQSRRHDGKCGFNVRANSMEKAEKAMYEHILEKHDG